MNAAATLPETGASESVTKSGDYYRQARSEILALVPDLARRILDIGCGEGMLGRRLLEKGADRVVGVEANPDVAARARHNLAEVICGDIETFDLPLPPRSFDCIVCGDVLEHLRDPVGTLRRLREYLDPSGVLVSSIPNVRHYSILNMLTEGLWTYQESGIMDATHLRFFTRREIESIFDRAGFRVLSMAANIDPAYQEVRASLPAAPQVTFSFGRLTIKDCTPDEILELFVIQYLTTACPIPA